MEVQVAFLPSTIIQPTNQPTAVASHGLRWIDYQYMGEEAEREHIRQAVEITAQV